VSNKYFRANKVSTEALIFKWVVGRKAVLLNLRLQTWQNNTNFSSKFTMYSIFG